MLIAYVVVFWLSISVHCLYPCRYQFAIFHSRGNEADRNKAPLYRWFNIDFKPTKPHEFAVQRGALFRSDVRSDCIAAKGERNLRGRFPIETNLTVIYKTPFPFYIGLHMKPLRSRINIPLQLACINI